MRVCITNGSHHPVLLAPSQNKLLSISMEDDQQQSSVSINGSQHKLGAFVIPQSIRSSSVICTHVCHVHMSKFIQPLTYCPWSLDFFQSSSLTTMDFLWTFLSKYPMVMTIIRSKSCPEIDRQRDNGRH